VSRIGTMSRTRKIATLAGVVAMLGGGIALSIGTSNAAESDSVVCQGLNTALQNNQNFIRGQQENPDAGSAGRIANRQAVIDQIQSRREAAGCEDGAAAQPAAGNSGARAGETSGESCAALDTALANNQNFIQGQQENPDANSAARIANRQAVIDLIESRREAAGCNGAEAPAAEEPAAEEPAEEPAAEEPAAEEPAAEEPADDGNANAGSGEQVCNGSTVTVSGEGGAPGAASNEFPIGTQLKVTNLDNNKSTTVPVTSVAGSCVLLNTAAFEQVREAGKFLIRRAVIERVG